MFNFHKISIGQYSISLFSAFLLWTSLCQSSRAVILRTGISSTSPTTLGGFIQWRADGRVHNTTLSNPFWEIEFSSRPSQTSLSFTHKVSTEPGESPNNGPATINLGSLAAGSRRVVERGFRHPGGSSDDADFYRLVVFVSRNRVSQVVFNNSGHFPISSRPRVPVFTLGGSLIPPVDLDI